MKRILTAAAFLFALLSSRAVVAQCLEYEPDVVRLSGVLLRETYRGRPNYKSIKKGDEAETIWVLRLKKAICVVAYTRGHLNSTVIWINIREARC